MRATDLHLTLSDSDVAALGEGRAIVRDGLVGPAAALSAHAELSRLADGGALRPARMSRGRQLDPTLRGDELVWVDAETAPEPLRPVVDLFDQVGEALRRDAWLSFGELEIQAARYPGGGARYVRHVDALRGAPEGRVATAIWYANPGWTAADGGQLCLHQPDGVIEIEPLIDRLVLFLSDRVEHEVLPAHAARFALTGWYKR